MQFDILTILLLVVAVFYLIMLPGYLVMLMLRIHRLDIIEMLTVAFGVGTCVLATLSTVLALTGSIGLTFTSLMVANTVFLAAVCVIMYVRGRSKRVSDPMQDKAPQA